MATTEVLRTAIRDVKDFPKPGIIFKDITPLLQNGPLFGGVIDMMALRCEAMGITQVVAIESRGFIFGGPLAYALKAGLVIVRKPKKLPFRTKKIEYALEYGTDQLEMHVDSLHAGDRVVIVDDILATGGTASATASLVAETGAKVEALVFLSELAFLRGREKLKGHNVISLVSFE